MIGDGYGAGAYGWMGWDNDTDTLKLGTQTGGYALYMPETGYVGIGTATPNNLLQVQDSDRIQNAASTTYLGYQAGLYDVGQWNSFIGYQAGYGSSTASTGAANKNIAVGYQSLFSNSTGADNVALGDEALYSNTTGSHNSAVGSLALNSNTTGTKNSAFGRRALVLSSSGDSNSAVGYQVLTSNTIGYSNTAMGDSSLGNNTTASYNSAFGGSRWALIDTGSANSAFDSWAGLGSSGYSFASTTLMGYEAGLSLQTASGTIAIGYRSDS